MARVIFHIDLNAFFASAEELRHPEYKDEPVAIGSLSSRGVLSTANYKAREFGVHSAMPVQMAKKLCPQLVILPGDYAYYRELSSKFFAYLRRYSGMLEILSVDECYLDVTETIKQYSRPMDLAVDIQMGVKEELGLSCSIGVAPTKFLAKMASDMYKPMGITILRRSEIPSKLWPLPVEDVVGIGKKTVPLLKEQGIHTIGDLADEDNAQAVRAILKSSYYPLMDCIRGRSSDRLSFSRTRKSISHSRTFQHDLYTLEEVLSEARRILQELTASMQAKNIKGAQVSLTLRDQDFHNMVRSVSLKQYTRDFAVLNEAVSGLIYEFFEPVGYRLLGISIGSLKDQAQVVLQPTLFDQPRDATQDLVKRFNTLSGSPLLMKASDLLKKKEQTSPEDPAKKTETKPDRSALSESSEADSQNASVQLSTAAETAPEQTVNDQPETDLPSEPDMLEEEKSHAG